MPSQCSNPTLTFQPLGARAVVARFDGGAVTSDGGALLLGEAERLTGALRQFAACFTDHRDPDAIEHTVWQLVRQRVYGLALGTTGDIPPCGPGLKDAPSPSELFPQAEDLRLRPRPDLPGHALFHCLDGVTPLLQRMVRSCKEIELLPQPAPGLDLISLHASGGTHRNAHHGPRREGGWLVGGQKSMRPRSRGWLAQVV